MKSYRAEVMCALARSNLPLERRYRILKVTARSANLTVNLLRLTRLCLPPWAGTNRLNCVFSAVAGGGRYCCRPVVPSGGWDPGRRAQRQWETGCVGVFAENLGRSYDPQYHPQISGFERSNAHMSVYSIKLINLPIRP